MILPETEQYIPDPPRPTSVPSGSVSLDILPKPHSKGQEEFLTHKGSIICFAGKRWGKTLIAGVKLLIEGFSNPGLYWWVGLSWKSASLKRAWRTLKKFHRLIWLALGIKDPSKFVRENDKELYFPNGLVIWFRTADNPDSLQGEGIKGLVLDEASFMPRNVWENYLEPTTIDFGAWVIIISTANGIEWMSELWEKVARGDYGDDWIAREYTTFDNVKLMENPKSRARLEQIVKNSDKFVVLQEYYAKRLAGVNKPVDPKALEQCMKYDRIELPYNPNIVYTGTVDTSGGGKNRYTMAIEHKVIDTLAVNNITGEIVTQERIIVDVLKGELFADVYAVTKQYAEIFKKYGVRIIKGDKYAADWPVKEYLKHGITFLLSEYDKSDAYTEAIPMINQVLVELVDNREMKDQFNALEQKKVGNRLKIDHPTSGPVTNDDYANVVCLGIAELKKELEYSNNATSSGKAEKPENANTETWMDEYESAWDVAKVIQ